MNENAASSAAPSAMKMRAQDQRDEDPEGEHPLLVLGRHRERGHDDHEDEEVVDRQALLDDVAGEVLAPKSHPAIDSEDDAERDRDRDVEDRPADRLAEADHVAAPSRDDQVQGEQGEDAGHGEDPGQECHIEHDLIMADSAASASSSRPADRGSPPVCLAMVAPRASEVQFG